MTSSRNADAHGAVDHAVVERARDEPDVADQDRAVDHHRPLGDPVDAEDRDLGVVHERRREEPAQPAGARDGERRAAQLLRRERPGGGRGAQPGDLRRQLLDRLRRSVADDGDHEPGLGLHRDPEVDVVEVDDLVAVEARVQRGMAAERLDRRAKHERQVACSSPRVSERCGEVALLDHGHRRHLAMRAGQMLGDRAAARPRSGSRRPRRLPAPGGGPRTAASVTGPLTGQRGEVDAELGRRAAAPPASACTRLCAGSVTAEDAIPGTPSSAPITTRSSPTGTTSPSSARMRLTTPGRRRRHLDGRLVGLDLDQQVVLGDLLADGDQPADDLALGDPLAEVGHAELVGHQNAMTFVIAASTRSGDGR